MEQRPPEETNNLNTATGWEDLMNAETNYEQAEREKPESIVKNSERFLEEIKSEFRNLAGNPEADVREDISKFVTEYAENTIAETEKTAIVTEQERQETIGAVVTAEIATIKEDLDKTSNNPIKNLFDDGYGQYAEAGESEIAKGEPALAGQVGKVIDKAKGQSAGEGQEGKEKDYTKELEEKADKIITGMKDEYLRKHSIGEKVNGKDVDISKVDNVEKFFKEGRGVKELMGIYSELGVNEQNSETLDKHMQFMLSHAFDQHYDNPEQFVSHGFDHTLNVAKYTNQIVENVKFDDGSTVLDKVMDKYGIKNEAQAKFLLQNVALLHDFGYPVSESEGLGKTAHGVAGADLVKFGEVEQGSGTYIKDVISKLVGVEGEDAETMINDLRNSVLFHSADKVETTAKNAFSAKITITKGELLSKHGDFVKIYNHFKKKNDGSVDEVNIEVRSEETKTELIKMIKDELAADRLSNEDVQKIIGEYEEKITVIKNLKELDGRFVDLLEKKDNLLGLRYQEVDLENNPLQTIIRMADNMDMKPERFSEIQREPLFLDFVKELGSDSGKFTEDIKDAENTIEAIKKQFKEGKIDEETKDIQISYAEQLYEQLKTDILADVIVKENYDKTSPMIEKIREIAIKQDSESYRHFGGCEAIKDVQINGERIDIQVDEAKYAELNETKVKEKETDAAGKEVSVEVNIGKYQIWRMAQAYKSIFIQDNNHLQIFVNGVKWEL
jgi:hypothetical protein